LHECKKCACACQPCLTRSRPGGRE
jgi:hypothetical protein